MTDQNTASFAITQANALTCGLFLLSSFGIVAARQVLASIRIFVLQSLFLAASALLLGIHHASLHLYLVSAITIVTKCCIIPYVLARLVGQEQYACRELSQALNIPFSLLVAMILSIFAYYIASPLLVAGGNVFARLNLPVGLAGLLLGALALGTRREAIPQVMGILGMENGAFLAGISIAPDLPLMAELAAAFDVLILAVVLGFLARHIHQSLGSTEVGLMADLKEE